MKHKKIVSMIGVIILVILAGFGVRYCHQQHSAQSTKPRVSQSAKKTSKNKKKAPAKQAKPTDPAAAKYEIKGMRPLNNNTWKHPSMYRAYPDVNAHPGMWIRVSTARQRVYFIDRGHTIYEMYCSTGQDHGTPIGTFHIQQERGENFFNAASGEGANYWTSFKNHGEFLFHSVPVNQNGRYMVKEAEDLGKTAKSHGCVRLAIPDARWIYTYVPYNTKVVIK